MREGRNTKTGAQTSIVGGVLYYEDCPQLGIDDADLWQELDHCKAVRVISLASDFRLRVYHLDATLIETLNVEMTLRSERRGGSIFWYAYRRVFGTLYKRYVGRSTDINTDRIVEVARKLPPSV